MSDRIIVERYDGYRRGARSLDVHVQDAGATLDAVWCTVNTLMTEHAASRGLYRVVALDTDGRVIVNGVLAWSSTGRGDGPL